MSIFAKTYTQGNYYPKHPEKCLNTNGKLGNKPVITYRSSWELKFMRFCDKYESVLEILVFISITCPLTMLVQNNFLKISENNNITPVPANNVSIKNTIYF